MTRLVSSINILHYYSGVQNAKGADKRPSRHPHQKRCSLLFISRLVVIDIKFYAGSTVDPADANVIRILTSQIRNKQFATVQSWRFIPPDPWRFLQPMVAPCSILAVMSRQHFLNACLLC